MCKKHWQRNKHNSELEEEPSVRTQPFILGIHRGYIPQILYSPKTNHFETPDPLYFTQS